MSSQWHPKEHRHVRERREGVGSRCYRENKKYAVFTTSYNINSSLIRWSIRGQKNRLQSNLNTVYNPRTIRGVCVLYTISGGSCYRVVPRRTEPPGSSSSTNSCDILPPGGSVVTFGSRLLITDSLLLPVPAPAGALSAHIGTQSFLRYLRYDDPFQKETIVRRAGRIGRRRLERIRSVSGKAAFSS